MALLTVVSVVPVWAFEYFPSLDGPLHVYIGHVLSRYDAQDGSVFRKYFELNPSIEPNAAIYLLVRPLGQVLAPETIEKVVVSLFALLLVGSAGYAGTAVHRGALPLAFAFIPLTFNVNTHAGFFNFCFSLAGFLMALGYWLRHWRTPGPWHFVVLGLLATALIFIHLFGWAVLATVVGVSSVTAWLLARVRANGSTPSWRAIATRCVGLGLAFLPGLVVSIDFFLRYQLETRQGAETDLGFLAMHLAAMSFLASYDVHELVLFIPLVALVILLPAAARDTWARPVSLGLLAGLLVLTAMYFLSPATTKGVPLWLRYQPFIAATALIWLASCFSAELRSRYRLVALAATLAVVLDAGHRMWRYEAISGFIAEYLSVAPHVAPGHTVLSLNFANAPLDGSPARLRFDPLWHTGARIAQARDGIYLTGALLSTALYGYFPVQYREPLDPYVHIGPVEDPGGETELDLVGYRARTGGSIDYVILWPMTDELLKDPEVVETMSHLAGQYQLLHISEGRGLVRLYQRQPSSDATAPQ